MVSTFLLASQMVKVIIERPGNFIFSKKEELHRHIGYLTLTKNFSDLKGLFQRKEVFGNCRKVMLYKVTKYHIMTNRSINMN
jgi:hypothetical protein